MATDASGAERSYLASEKAFAVMKDLESRNLVIPIVGDFGGPKALRWVGSSRRDLVAMPRPVLVKRSSGSRVTLPTIVTVLSGILERQADELTRAYAPWLDLSVADRDDGWILMHAQRRA